ncbi:MAG: hypothetical protein CMJ64_29505 [Planctomycetaceae bacterium]|nr:hypothetical protein [Planctomycetaceae bacterium]
MYRRSLASIVLCAVLSTAAWAGGGRCHHCGGKAGDLVCQLVKTTKTIEKTCYDCTHEDICVPGPSKKCQKHVDSVNGKCNLLCKITWTEWIPGCAKLYTRNKLTKYIVKKEVPSYEWVVTKCCDGCKGKVQGADIEPGVDIPTPPPIEAELRYGNPHNLPVSLELPASEWKAFESRAFSRKKLVH